MSGQPKLDSDARGHQTWKPENVVEASSVAKTPSAHLEESVAPQRSEHVADPIWNIEVHCTG